MATLLKTIRRPVSANIKIALVVLAFLIVAGTLFFTNRLANDLKHSERNTVRVFTSIFTSATSAPQESTNGDGHSSPDIVSDIALQLGLAIDFPIIITNLQKEVEPFIDPKTGKQSYGQSFIRNVDYDTTASIQEQKQQLEEQIREMGQVYDPLPIYFVQNGDSTISNYVFYGESNIVKEIRLLPYVGIVIISMFIFVGYISFSHVKRNEQSNIWVGMAKETAHQLGTPLSSLLGWIELLRYTPEDTDQVLEAADEMQRDVERLNKIAHRFSKIGSAAEVKVVELTGVLRHVVTYFERRLPHL
ncbi:MAG: histidine kinase dimerization/phospho-acceptor domain-containing protein, partial [Bacteroidota bacterium]